MIKLYISSTFTRSEAFAELVVGTREFNVSMSGKGSVYIQLKEKFFLRLPIDSLE